MEWHNLSVCGGTFDHLHLGHKKFLRLALSKSKRLLIGLTTDEFVRRNKENSNIQSYEERKKELENFLSRESLIDKIIIAPINDGLIPDVWSDFQIEAIFVSKKTISGASIINTIRKEQKKYPLIVELIPLTKGADLEYISSSKIRNGEIDRNGQLYIQPLWKKKNLFLPVNLREVLQKPFGVLTLNWDELPKVGKKENLKFATVGDVTTVNVHLHGIKPHIAIIDLHIGRVEKVEYSKLGFSNEKKHSRIVNPPGTLSGVLFEEIQNIFSRNKDENHILEIIGEEDLSVLPLVLAAPLGYHIFYGQPGEGMVDLDVTEKTKEHAYNLVSQFTF